MCVCAHCHYVYCVNNRKYCQQFSRYYAVPYVWNVTCVDGSQHAGVLRVRFKSNAFQLTVKNCRKWLIKLLISHAYFLCWFVRFFSLSRKSNSIVLRCEKLIFFICRHISGNEWLGHLVTSILHDEYEIISHRRRSKTQMAVESKSKKYEKIMLFTQNLVRASCT